VKDANTGEIDKEKMEVYGTLVARNVGTLKEARQTDSQITDRKELGPVHCTIGKQVSSVVSRRRKLGQQEEYHEY
jgi:hypothetical protein